MMRRTTLSMAIAAATFFAAQQVSALPFTAPDPRSLAMGGTGVASGSTANAVFFNPALLAAAQAEEDFALEFPIASFRAADPNDLIGAMGDFSSGNYVQNFNDAITAFNADPTNTTKQEAVQTTATDLAAALNNLSGKEVLTELTVASTVGIPGRRFGMSVYGSMWGGAGATVSFDASDIVAISNASDDAGSSTPTTAPTLNTSINVRAATIKEAGVAMARRINILGRDIAVGVTPKYMEATLYDYVQSGDALDQAGLSANQNSSTDTAMTFDAGMVVGFDNGFKLGLVARNVIPGEFTTGLGNPVTVDTLMRTGVVYQNEWVTFAADMDLTENAPIGNESPTKYMSAGAELDIFDIIQGRVGYRTNTINPDDTQISAGAGFWLLGLHMDLTATKGQGNNYGAAIQTGIRF